MDETAPPPTADELMERNVEAIRRQRDAANAAAAAREKAGQRRPVAHNAKWRRKMRRALEREAMAKAKA